MTESAETSQFATAVNCMDGRVQDPITAFARQHFDVPYVDMITAAGVVQNITAEVRERVGISIEAHASKGIVVAAHAECAGNPVADDVQKTQCMEAARSLKADWPTLEVLAVWVVPGEGLEFLQV